MKRSIVGLALALVLSVAFSDGARAERYFIDREVWAHFQSYLKTIGSTRPGAYAITTDGHGAFYVYCQETRCMAGPSYGQDAVDRCERENGTDCVVFAVRGDIKVEYEIVDDGSGSSSGSIDVTTPPATRITAAPDVQARIKAYLVNAGLTSRSWALAIAKNGSKVESAACSASSSFVGGPCEPTKGSPQELANREALARCGGPPDCVLLYEGRKMATGVEIVDSTGALVFGQVATTAPVTAAPAPSAPAAPAVVRISSALRGKVEQYLDNSASFGNTYRFLAVNAAGTKIGTANCTKMTTWMTDACGGATSPYEGAKRVALNDCGGPDECRLIFEGAKKIGGFEIEWYDGDNQTVTALLKNVETPQAPNTANPAPSAPAAVASAEPVAPVAPPKPALKIAVSPALQSDIDSYLRNVQSTARLWAFAIAKNGTEGAMASCPAGGGWSGGGACEPVKGGPQELANREALKKCGGSDDCVLLYVGGKKASDVEVVAQ
jgi:hypothetical protein